jgi:cytochrome P450
MFLDASHYPVALLAGAVIFLLYTITALQRKYNQYRISRANNCQPVQVKVAKDPFLGLDNIWENLDAAKNHILLERGLSRFRQYGNTFRARRLRTPIIVTREPQNVKTILSLRFKDYGLGNRIKAFGPLLGHGIFTTDGEHWAQSRAMIRPNFVKDQVAHLDIFEELMADLLALIPTDGTTVDLQELFFCYTIDSATEFLFGHSVQSLKKRLSGVQTDENDFASSFNYAQDAIATNTRLGPLRVLFRDRKAEQCNRVCHELVEQFVEKALKYRANYDEEKAAVDDGDQKQRYLFLQGLAQQTGDRTRIRDELMNVLLAGRDTTASLLSNMFFMLAKNPLVWDKLREEVASLEGRAPTYTQLRNLTYLKYCLNECESTTPMASLSHRLIGQPSVFTRLSRPTPASPIPIQSSRSAAAPMAKHPCSSPRAASLLTVYTQCTAAKISTAPMPTSTGQSAGPICDQDGSIFPLMGVLASASASNMH